MKGIKGLRDSGDSIELKGNLGSLLRESELERSDVVV